MASSLGASFGVAISAAIFTALSANPGAVTWLEGVVTFVGRQDNVAVRQAAFVAYGANLLMIIAAIISILLLVPRGRPGEQADASQQADVVPTGSRAGS
jgi:DHA2 family multidrug resistance protein-like MFS transporter